MPKYKSEDLKINTIFILWNIRWILYN